MRALLVVPTDPPPHGAAGLDEAREAVLPDAFFLQAAEEALDHPVLPRRVRRDELLAQRVVLALRAAARAACGEPADSYPGSRTIRCAT